MDVVITIESNEPVLTVLIETTGISTCFPKTAQPYTFELVMEIEHFAIAKYKIANKMTRITPMTMMTVKIGVVARAAAFPIVESKD